MKCFYHPATDAVSTCSTCGKAACHGCIWDAGGRMTCTSCYNLSVMEYNKGASRASRRILFSWIFAVVAGSLIGFIATANHANALIAFPLAIYSAWALYWGVPTLWGWCKALLRSIGCFIFLNPVGLLFILFFFCYFFVVFGLMYGFYGGAIYQFLKYRKLARSTVPLIPV